MQIMNGVKPKIEPSPTLRFVTQCAMKGSLRWFGLGHRLNEPLHFERFVIHPHFRNVNILIDIIQGSMPLGTFVTFPPLMNNLGITYFRD
jgi:hypothetical protein